MTPTFYPVSTGPGSADLLTLQAIKVLKECDAIFFPESEKNTIALESISQITGLDLSQKALIPCHFSMTDDKEKSAAEYQKVASDCLKFLREGKSVAMLSIGDVSLYSTAARTARLIKNQGFEVKFISGVNSFSAPLKAGDKIIFGDTGSYSFAQVNYFNGINFPDIFFYSEKKGLQEIKSFDFKNYEALYD